MVATKTSKATKAKAAPKAKYTYRERVLDACAHLQQHKKRIHMATLRAEIHRAAEERNDKMGPHAHRYIHKAVDGLVDEGMLERLPEPATISVTPSAKKTFKKARKSLNLSSPPSSQADQEMFIRLVSHSPHKRRRQSNVHFDGAADADVGESISARVSKRPRRSTGGPRKSRASAAGPSRAPRRSMAQPSASQGPKPLSRMTKAELLAKIKELQERQQALRSESPLSELSDDEDSQAIEARLREQTQHYRERIEELEQQLALGFASAVGGPSGATYADDSMDMDEQPTQVEDEVPTRPSTPTINAPSISEPNSPEQPIAHSQAQPIPPSQPVPRTQAQRLLGVTRPGAPMGVTRTQSGSFISHLSKRPTPAPSDSGDEHREDLDMTSFEQDGIHSYEHEQDFGSHEYSQTQESLFESTQGERLAQEKVASLEQQLAALNQDLVDVRCASAAAELRMQRSAQALEDKVVAREHTITGLEADVANAQRQEADLQAMIAAKDQEITQLQTQLRQAKAEYEAAAQQEQALRSSVTELQQTLVARDTVVAEQTALINDSSARLAAANSSNEVLALQLAASDAERTRLLGELEGTLAGKTEVQRQFREEVQALRVAAEETAKEMRELEEERDELRNEREHLEAVSQSLEEEVNELKDQLEEERVQAELLGAQLADRDAQLAARAREAEELQDKISAFASQVSSLEQQVSASHAKVAELESALATSREETAAMTKVRDDEAAKVTDLRIRLDVSEKTNIELRSTIADRDAQLASVSADLETSRQQHKATREELATSNKLAETEQARAASLAGMLEQTKAALQAAQEEANLLKAAKKQDEETIARLKGSFGKYKVQQAQWLSEMSMEFDDAHASTVSFEQKQRVAEAI
ncbi:uncharacterized protein SCHCODRAFT_02691830 [Schizophyllum commune H4-8]|nr:uncharacterized protein SCHCODRAFT_02691830 [Schizophyllum commune H4-8]KAI5888492.1 hypothetical protein SCHCODRAFT_02691830 [Schizophyllum commune H4-8]